tara:strand:- start:814 stop:1077 length:264 start_codon:yes stop_codon:yes gene_type:complete
MIKRKSLKRDVYACKTGDYAGQMFVIIKETKNFIECLSIPEVKNVKIPVKSFDTGRKNGIIEYVETLPRSVFKISKAQYEKNENINN